MISCCKHTIKNKLCLRQKDKKLFKLPRRFTRKKCTSQPVRGFTMKSSCAPYKYCKMVGGKNKTQKRRFLYNPNNPSLSFDVYIDKNPNDTIPIKYKTVEDVKNTIKKLEHLYKTNKYTHKRIWQVGMIMKVRLQAMNKHKKSKYPNAKKVYSRYILSKKYFKFLGKRTKIKNENDRKKLKFIF